MERIAGDLGVMPVYGEEDWSIAQHTEIESVVGVLPDVFAAHDDPLAESLLQTSMELVAVAWLQRSRNAWSTGEQRRQNGI